MSNWKRFKYKTLRRIPGSIGRKYNAKYELQGTSWRFLDAIDATSSMVSIDLGANIGEYSQLLATRAKKVYAFEPDPWALEQLRANTAHLSNIEIVEAAAGTCEASVKLYRHPEFSDNPIMNSQSSSVVSDKFNISLEDYFEVPQVDVIAFMRGLDQDIGVLKVDIEGAEVDLFEKLFDEPELLSRIHYIFAETHEKKIAGHESRVAALKSRAEKIKRPVIDLTWH